MYAFVLFALAAADDPRLALREAYGIDTLSTRPVVSHRLVVRDADGTIVDDAVHAIDVRDGLYRKGDVAYDGAAAWRIDAGRLVSLDGDATRAIADSSAYHYARLFGDAATKARGVDGGVELTPANAEAFVVEIDPATGHVRENVFDGGKVRARELDHRDFDGFVWPMRYEVRVDGALVRTGEFSELAFGSALPVLAHAGSRTIALEPPARGAALVDVVSTSANEYNLGTDASATILVHARSEAHFANAKIHVARRTSAGVPWPTPEPAPFSDARYSDSDPHLSRDGRWLYFISNRPRPGDAEPRKDTDIWRVALTRDGFGAPEHLGATINSAGMELGPEVHDGTLYFNSTRPNGPAALAIYSVRLDDDLSTATPVALPAPFNAGRAQGDFTLSPDGGTALFWSERDGRDADLFRVRRVGERWGPAERLPAPYSSAGFDFTPQFSADGATLYFASDRKAGAPVVVAGEVMNGQSNVYAARSP